MGHLPADLDRIGDQLAAAAARSIASRRRRRLALRTGVTAAVVLTALAPAALGPAERVPGAAPLLLASAPAIPTACDQPRGGRFEIPACRPAPALTIGRPGRW